MAAERRSGRDEASGSPGGLVRGAATLFILLGIGFGGGAGLAVAHLRQTGELPMTPFGFRALSGPFEELGQRWFSVLGAALVVVCAIDIVAGVLLWRGRRRGLELGAATTLPAFILAVGFALPFLLVGVPLRMALAIAGRRSLE
jgi:hypothetical protein